MAANGDQLAAQNVPLPPGDDDWHVLPPQQPQWNAPPPWFPPYVPQQQQHVPQPQPHRVSLKPIWTTKIRTWFTLAEAMFVQYNITDSKMKFFLVLPALSEETLDRVKAVVDMPDQHADPYGALKTRLCEIFQPDVWASVSQLTHMRELGDLKPSQLMDSMLALLPATEQPGFIFKSLFLDRLPGDMRDHVQAHAERLTPQELAALADNIWQSRNAKRSGVVAALSTLVPPTPPAEPSEEVVEMVAALNLGKKQQAASKKNTRRPHTRGGGQKSGNCKLVCWMHRKHGKDAYNCADVENCSFSAEN